MKAKPSPTPGRALLESKGVVEQWLPRSSHVAAFRPPLFRLNKILVPVDFSDLSKKALGYAVQFAEHKGGRIVLLHVVEPRPRRERQPKVDQRDGSRLDEAERKLLELGEHELGSVLTYDIRVQTGKPYREIVNAAKALSVDLIVMATRGSTGVRRALEGSTAERIVRHAPCPVLVVREPEHEFLWESTVARSPFRNTATSSNTKGG